jgi:hypothetical protein
VDNLLEVTMQNVVDGRGWGNGNVLEIYDVGFESLLGNLVL